MKSWQRARRVMWSLTIVVLIGLGSTSAPSEAQDAVSTAVATMTMTPQDATEILYVLIDANIRACPSLTCEVITSVTRRTQVTVIGSEQGDRIGGSTVWRIVRVNERQGYIHSSLLSRRRPPVGRPTIVPTIESTTGAQSFACDCSRTCGDLTTCAEARFQLEQCGCTQRDRNDDGVPCESLCRAP